MRCVLREKRRPEMIRAGLDSTGMINPKPGTLVDLADSIRLVRQFSNESRTRRDHERIQVRQDLQRLRLPPDMLFDSFYYRLRKWRPRRMGVKAV